jgi:hypothetical protein
MATKAFIWGVLKDFFFLFEEPIKVNHCKKKTLSFRMHPQLINKDCK